MIILSLFILLILLFIYDKSIKEPEIIISKRRTVRFKPERKIKKKKKLSISSIHNNYLKSFLNKKTKISWINYENLIYKMIKNFKSSYTGYIQRYIDYLINGVFIINSDLEKAKTIIKHTNIYMEKLDGINELIIHNSKPDTIITKNNYDQFELLKNINIKDEKIGFMLNNQENATKKFEENIPVLTNLENHINDYFYLDNNFNDTDFNHIDNAFGIDKQNVHDSKLMNNNNDYIKNLPKKNTYNAPQILINNLSKQPEDDKQKIIKYLMNLDDTHHSKYKMSEKELLNSIIENTDNYEHIYNAILNSYENNQLVCLTGRMNRLIDSHKIKNEVYEKPTNAHFKEELSYYIPKRTKELLTNFNELEQTAYNNPTNNAEIEMAENVSNYMKNIIKNELYQKYNEDNINNLIDEYISVV